MIDTLKNLSYIELFITQWIIGVLQYILICGFVFYLFWILLKRRTKPLKISQPRHLKKQIKSEISNSIIVKINHTLPTLIFLKTNTWMAHRAFYPFEKHSLLYHLGCLIFVFFLHDAYFYWTHRLFHHPKLLKWFHITHHKSKEVTPFTTYSFHFVEGFVQTIIIPLSLLFFEVHISIVGIFFFLSFLFNINGHTGFSLSSRRLRSYPLFRWFLFSTNHAQHHLRSHGNYGLYLKFWDKAMGTYIGEYGDRIK